MRKHRGFLYNAKPLLSELLPSSWKASIIVDEAHGYRDTRDTNRLHESELPIRLKRDLYENENLDGETAPEKSEGICLSFFMLQKKPNLRHEE